MTHMKRDMTDVWSEFAVDVEACLDHLLESVENDFGEILALSIPETRVESGSKPSRSAVRDINDVLYHRKDLALHDIEDAINEFRDDLFRLRTNALAPIRTAFIGCYMEEAYHAANMEYGE